MNNEIVNEFSREFNLDLIKKSGSNIMLEGTKEECEQLAIRYSIPAISTLEAKCHLKKMAQKEKGDYLLEVNMNAVIIQRCILTLEELTENISERFSITFKEARSSNNDSLEAQEIEFALDDEDIVFIEDNIVDIGEHIAEYLSLSINPYPKKDNVSASDLPHKVISEDEIEEETTKENPFTVLKDLKHKT